MKHPSNDIPVACGLTSADRREREATLIFQFSSAVIGTEELPDGYAFRVPGDGKWLGLAAELIGAERECCRSLRFELVAEPNMGPIIVRVTGPAGTKEFLKTVLRKADASI